ncbi:hypothetical protein E3N88_44333 [Mikania micrantha]|uniref:Uncharacterized protein n=1 Tax=Mikania micrantha TaxID=192012 RepID=A0A5N6LCB0_9ASTR|nr:hypothetical protein E3N88_44333 [Mikania micrantha]
MESEEKGFEKIEDGTVYSADGGYSKSDQKTVAVSYNVDGGSSSYENHSPFVRVTLDDFLNHRQVKPNKTVNFSVPFQGPPPVHTKSEQGELSGAHEDDYADYEDYDDEQFSPVYGAKTFGAGPTFATTGPYVPNRRNQHHREFPRPDIPYPQQQPSQASKPPVEGP